MDSLSSIIFAATKKNFTMKKFFVSTFVLALLACMTSLQAQIKTPALSPSCKVMQTVGMTDVELAYSRPSMRGRTIFGALVPYDAMWRTGANAATKISFSKDVQIGGSELAAGDYAVFSKPGMNSWEVYFFPYTTASAGGYGDAVASATATCRPMKLANSVETFEISFVSLNSNGGTMRLAWENTAVDVAISAPTHKEAMKSIETTLAGPSNGQYYSAGVYMANNGEDLDKALSYIRKATESDDPKFWQIKTESEILAKNGKMAEAIAKAKQSLELATKAENANYIRINTENIAMWSKK